MSKITNPMTSMQSCIHAFMQLCHIIPTHLSFPASYLLSFPSSLFTPWPTSAIFTYSATYKISRSKSRFKSASSFISANVLHLHSTCSKGGIILNLTHPLSKPSFASILTSVLYRRVVILCNSRISLTSLIK
jgi:hypothetical protein